MSRIGEIKTTSLKKGALAIGGVVGTGLLFAYTWWPLGVAGAVGSLYLTWDWFKWRAVHGLRFK